MINKNAFLGKMVGSGFNQRTLAEAIGVSKNTLNNKVNGRGAFDTKEIEKICECLSITDGKEKADIFLAETSQ